MYPNINLDTLIETIRTVETCRVRSNELAQLLNVPQKVLVYRLKKLENAGAIKQIKTKSKKASLWELKVTSNQLSENQSLTISASTRIPFQKDYVTRRELYSLLDSIHTLLHEINTQLIVANQSLELVKFYWQRVLKNEEDRPGTSFTKY